MRIKGKVLAVALLALSETFAKSGSEHVADMCAVFGTKAGNPHLQPIFQSVTSEMDDGRTGRQKYTLNQKVKSVAPGFKWGPYTHRIFFHWGFFGDPRHSSALTAQINAATPYENVREKLWKIVSDEQARRNRRIRDVVARSTTYIGADNKQKGFAKREVLNSIAALAYDVHIIGDYIEGKDVPMKALASLKETRDDVVRAVRQIAEDDSEFGGIAELKLFQHRMKNADGVIDKILAEKILIIMRENIPGILMQCGTFRRVVELDEYSSATAGMKIAA